MLIRHRTTFLGQDPVPDQGQIESGEIAEETGRCEFLIALGKLPCAGSQCLRPVRDSEGTWKDMVCRLCDSSQPCPRNEQMYWDKGAHGEDWKNVIAALLTITEQPNFQDSTKPRVYMALAIRRVLNHIQDAEYLDLEHSPMGEWLMASMSSSFRELRISAVYVSCMSPFLLVLTVLAKHSWLICTTMSIRL